MALFLVCALWTLFAMAMFNISTFGLSSILCLTYLLVFTITTMVLQYLNYGWYEDVSFRANHITL